MLELGLIDRLPRLAVIQAEGAAPFYDLLHASDRSHLRPVTHPETLATAIRIGDPVSWPKALKEVTVSGGIVETVSEQEIADAKAVIGRCGIGCEPASAATLAGIRKLVESRAMAPNADVVAVLTGNVLKDQDYIFRYHTSELRAPAGNLLASRFANQPEVVPYDPARIRKLLDDRRQIKPKWGY
jgi:threonine synthase